MKKLLIVALSLFSLSAFAATTSTAPADAGKTPTHKMEKKTHKKTKHHTKHETKKAEAAPTAAK